MHDGSTLTAADVAYSIQLARNSERYSGRFSNVYGISPSGTDTVNISTARADLQLPYLLTVPVIKYGLLQQLPPRGQRPLHVRGGGGLS